MGDTIQSRDAGTSGLTVQHQPEGHATDCHALTVSSTATSGRGAAINAYTENSEAPAIRGQGAGPLLRLYNAAGVLKFEVANDGTISTQTIGALTVTGNATVGGTLGVTGAATLSSTLTVTGAATFNGGATVAGANFVVSGTGKGYRFRPLGTRLDCEATGSDWIFSTFSGSNFDGTQRTYLRLESGTTLAHACGTWIFTDTADSGAVHTIDGSGNKLGFHGATSVAKQTITGSRASGAALADLLTKLATVGLFTDGTSA